MMSRAVASFAILVLVGGMAMAVCPERKPHQTALPTYGWNRNYRTSNARPTPLHIRIPQPRVPCSLRATPTPSSDTLNYFRPTIIENSVGSYASRPSTIRTPLGPYGTTTDAYPSLSAAPTRNVSELLREIPLAGRRGAPYSNMTIDGILGLRVTANLPTARPPDKAEPPRLILRRSYPE